MDRDRRLLVLLGEHKVLTTSQIAAVEFGSVRRAQDRLRRLRELGVVFAFRESYPNGGTSQTRYALGYLGARLVAAQRAAKPPAPKAYAEQLERLALWPKLDHQLGVNGFFCALAAARNPARGPAADRDTGAPRSAALTQWWSEKRCTAFFVHYRPGEQEARLRPDGYGCWEEGGRVVRFFLEHDTGTEPLPKVAAKLDDYTAFPADAFGVLLFSVHSTRREIALRTALRRYVGGASPGVVIATAARDHGHLDGPAGPVWALWTPHNSPSVPRRHRLAELPERGPVIQRGATSTDQPYSEAAFDPDDRQILRRIDTPTSGQSNHLHADFGDDSGAVVLYDEANDEPDDDPYRAVRVPDVSSRRWA